jgi:hypothetical protein
LQESIMNTHALPSAAGLLGRGVPRKDKTLSSRGAGKSDAAIPWRMGTPDACAEHERFELKIAGGSAAELVAVVSAVIVAVGAAVALLLTTPVLLAAAPTSAIAGMSAIRMAQRPFHQRYPLDAAAEQVDPPTF